MTCGGKGKPVKGCPCAFCRFWEKAGSYGYEPPKAFVPASVAEEIRRSGVDPPFEIVEVAEP